MRVLVTVGQASRSLLRDLTSLEPRARAQRLRDLAQLGLTVEAGVVVRTKGDAQVGDDRRDGTDKGDALDHDTSFRDSLERLGL